MKGVCVFSCFQGPSIPHALPEVFKKASDLTKSDTHLTSNHALDWAFAQCRRSTKRGAWGRNGAADTAPASPSLVWSCSPQQLQLLSWSHLQVVFLLRKSRTQSWAAAPQKEHNRSSCRAPPQPGSSLPINQQNLVTAHDSWKFTQISGAALDLENKHRHLL